MPVAPTDPGAFSRDDLPLPPTMNYGAAAPRLGRQAPAPRAESAGMVDNGHRLPPHKAFDSYHPAPAVSPYMMLGAGTNNGTVNTYAAYVRPALDQQRANQEFERTATDLENSSDQPAPTYPPVFLNSGSYYPNYGAGQVGCL